MDACSLDGPGAHRTRHHAIQAYRFPIDNLHLNVTGPDRKGRRTVEIAHGRPGAPGASLTWHLTAAEWEQSPDLVTLLKAVQTSIDATAGPRPA